MRWLTETLAERPRLAVKIAAPLFAAIFLLRLIAPEAGAGVTFALSTAWVLIENVPVSALGYANRAAVFAFVALLVGRFATQLRRAEAESARHFELSLDMICTAGFDGCFKSVNPAFERTLGYREEEMVGRPFLDFVHPDDREKTEREATALADGKNTVQFQNRYLDSRGEIHWLEWASVPIPEENLIYAIARDVTERKALEQELERLSQRDPLTGAFNRRRFDEELSGRLLAVRRHGRSGALLLIDLDRFKSVNDELGHAAGDVALCEVARLLAENTRATDVIGRDAEGFVARLGGDEFAVLLDDVSPFEAIVVGERLAAALEAADLRIEGNRVPLAISVGVAPFDGRGGAGAEELLAHADRGMYVVKAGGGGGAAQARHASRELGAEPA